MHDCSENDLDQIIGSISSFFSRDIEKLVKGAINHSRRRNTAPFMVTKYDFEESFKRMKTAEKHFEKEKEGWKDWTIRKGKEGSNSAFQGVCVALGMAAVGIGIGGKGGNPGGTGQ